MYICRSKGSYIVIWLQNLNRWGLFVHSQALVSPTWWTDNSYNMLNAVQYLTGECSNVHYVMVSKTILTLSQRSKHGEFLFCWNMIVLPLPSSFLPPSPRSCLRCSVVFLTVVPSRLPCDPCSTAGCYTPTLERDIGKTHQLYSTMPREAKNGNSHWTFYLMALAKANVFFPLDALITNQKYCWLV